VPSYARKGDVRVSNIPEIKGHLDRLTQLSKGMQEQFASLKGPEAEAIKKNAKKAGARIGIGAGISFFGFMVASLALLYSLYVVILLVNIALDKLWLSALIVVGGYLIIGGGIIVMGGLMARSSAKELSKSTDDLKKQLKETGEAMKAEVDQIQELLKKEAEERQKQMAQMLEQAKAAAPTAAPAAIIGLLVLRMLKKRRHARKEQKALLKVIEMYEEARADSADREEA
jgi:Putative Actinobacterial Holin-X, holin superfamily III